MLDHRKSLKRGLLAGAVGVAALASAAPAMAAPTGVYADFQYCPLSNPALTSCLVSDTTSGSIKLGNQNVPINKLIRLQGGITQNPDTLATTFVNATNGKTLVAPPLDVPGGLLGITPPSLFPAAVQWVVNAAINSANGVTAQAELVGTPSVDITNIAAGEGTGVSLPLRVKLNNPFLGNNCYIGSSSSPVRFNLTTGRTSPPAGTAPITGNGGFLDDIAPDVLAIRNLSLVDNTFPVPGASGCGPLNGIVTQFLVNPVVNLKVGLPAARGKSTAILNGTTRLAPAQSVRNSNR